VDKLVAEIEVKELNMETVEMIPGAELKAVLEHLAEQDKQLAEQDRLLAEHDKKIDERLADIDATLKEILLRVTRGNG
jgi:hypothetical protein